MTTEEFIAKAKAVHGDKYDYSKVEYVNNVTKVCIICPEHGPFWQAPNNHISKGNGCPKCARIKKNEDTKNKYKSEFIAKAKAVHGDKYDYSKVEYTKSNDYITIICPKDGEFRQKAGHHLRGQGCPKCAQRYRALSQGLVCDTETLIAKLNTIFGDKYDYSKVNYVKNNEKVTVICKKHGEFTATPNSLISGHGCPKCGYENTTNSRRRTTEEFIERAKAVHGDKYDYSKVEYVNANTPVCIICPEHGPFWQSPVVHLRGNGCPKCTHPNANMTTEEFIAKSREVYGDKYDYSKVEYVNANTDVIIICPRHGEFSIKPLYFLKGYGCRQCWAEDNNIIQTTEEFIERAKAVHGDKYDYSKVEYKGSHSKVCIICPEHGPFWQVAKEHLKGSGCPRCSNKFKTTEDFIKQAISIHGNKYDYSKSVYIDAETPVCIICPEHGEFWQKPKFHLQGAGCPNCNGLRKSYKFNLLTEFESEYALKDFLMNNDINILMAIMTNIAPKFEPIKDDIKKALNNYKNEDPIKVLEDKYNTEDDDTTDSPVESKDNTNDNGNSFAPIDWDAEDDDDTEEVEKPTDDEPTISDIITEAREREIEVLNKIEHLLSPEIKEYIMCKFKNDKLREYMANAK